VACPQGHLPAGPEASIEAGESPAAWSALAFVLRPRAAPPKALVETGELPAKGWSMAQAFASRLPEVRLKALAEAAELLPAEWAPKAIAS
jgi:hypothetical protein